MDALVPLYSCSSASNPGSSSSPLSIASGPPGDPARLTDYFGDKVKELVTLHSMQAFDKFASEVSSSMRLYPDRM